MFAGSPGIQYELEWKIENVACPAPGDKVMVEFNPDSDLDSVQDCMDICEGGDDLVNTDGWGMPDDCDCDPNDADDEFIEVNGVNYLDNQIAFGAYHGSYALSSSGKVMPNNTVHFKAGHEITLLSGFIAYGGSNFTAKMEYCNDLPAGHLADTIKATQRNVSVENLVQNAASNLALNIQPNPFKGQTTINYSLSQPATISIAIYNQIGQLEKILLKKGTKTIGNYSLELNATDLFSGMYFIVLTTDGEDLVKKVVLQ